MAYSKNHIIKYFVIALLIGLIFFLNLKPPLDPDLGWHLRAGQDLLLTMQIPRLDTYSYTMPDWQRESHEWLTSGLIYLVYTNYGFFILAILFALISISAFFIVSRIVKTKIEYSLLAALLGSLGALPIIGIRAQTISILGLAILLFILFRFRAEQNKKTIYWLPLLFFVWVNLHGGFSIGLVVLAGFLFLEGLKIIYLYLQAKKLRFFHSPKTSSLPKQSSSRTGLWGLLTKQRRFFIPKNELVKESLAPQSWVKLAYLALFSFAVTFVNPYGYRVYSLIWVILKDTYGRSRIGEWQSFAISSPIGWEFVMYGALLIILMIIYFKKVDLTLLGLGAGAAYMAISSWRNLPVAIILTIPLWVYIVQAAVDPVFSKLLNQKLAAFMFLLAAIIIGYQQITNVWKISNDQKLLADVAQYPYQAVQFIKNNPDKFTGNMFNEYNWGGYLIWQLPEHKVFIDGRMPHLTIGDRHIFKDFNDLEELKQPLEIIKKYNVDWFLIYSNRLLRNYLPSEGFTEIYADDLAVILKKD